MGRIAPLLLGCSILVAAVPVARGEEDDGGVRTIQLGNVVAHHKDRPEHNNRPLYVGFELRRPSDWLSGAATFRNSYRQRAGYAYVGRRFDRLGGSVYAKVTGGLLVGYRGDHRDKIPFNRYGLAPAVIPSAGVQVSRYSGELVVLAASALMFNFGIDF